MHEGLQNTHCTSQPPHSDSPLIYSIQAPTSHEPFEKRRLENLPHVWLPERVLHCRGNVVSNPWRPLKSCQPSSLGIEEEHAVRQARDTTNSTGQNTGDGVVVYICILTSGASVSSSPTVQLLSRTGGVLSLLQLREVLRRWLNEGRFGWRHLPPSPVKGCTR